MRKTTCSTSLIVPDRLCAGMASALQRLCGTAAATAGAPNIARNVRRSTLLMATPLPYLHRFTKVRGPDANDVALTKALRQPTAPSGLGGSLPQPPFTQPAENSRLLVPTGQRRTVRVATWPVRMPARDWPMPRPQAGNPRAPQCSGPIGDAGP